MGDRPPDTCATRTDAGSTRANLQRSCTYSVAAPASGRTTPYELRAAPRLPRVIVGIATALPRVIVGIATARAATCHRRGRDGARRSEIDFIQIGAPDPPRPELDMIERARHRSVRSFTHAVRSCAEAPG